MPLAEPLQDLSERLRAMQARHRRAEMRCGLLERIAEQAQARGSGEPAEVTARALIEHFDAFLAEEHADRALLAALARAASRRRKPRTAELVDALIAAQDEIARLWEPARAQLVELTRGAHERIDAAACARFVDRALAHVTRDERELAALSEAATNAQRRDRRPAPADPRPDSRAAAQAAS